MKGNRERGVGGGGGRWKRWPPTRSVERVVAGEEALGWLPDEAVGQSGMEVDMEMGLGLGLEG